MTSITLNRKTNTAILGSTLVWVAFHAWVTHDWFGIPVRLAVEDSLISNTLMFLAALLLGTITLYYLPKARKFYRTLLLIAVDALFLSLLCLWLARGALEMRGDGDAAYLLFLERSLPVRGAIFFLMIAFSGISLIFYSQAREQEENAMREASTAALAKEAELQKLQLQLQPHFLFNCLNSINAMVVARPQEAQKMVQQLSDFLRTTLRRADEQWITFAEELNYLQLYLAIEKIRFGHRLEVNVNHDDGSHRWKMPTLLLQPLVENAIKFGLYGTTDKVVIGIDARVKEGHLEMTVTNPFDPDLQPPPGSGFGLSGLKRRLYLLYARNDLMDTQMANQVFSVTLKIPQPA